MRHNLPVSRHEVPLLLLDHMVKEGGYQRARWVECCHKYRVQPDNAPFSRSAALNHIFEHGTIKHLEVLRKVLIEYKQQLVVTESSLVGIAANPKGLELLVYWSRELGGLQPKDQHETFITAVVARGRVDILRWMKQAALSKDTVLTALLPEQEKHKTPHNELRAQSLLDTALEHHQLEAAQYLLEPPSKAIFGPCELTTKSVATHVLHQGPDARFLEFLQKKTQWLQHYPQGIDDIFRSVTPSNADRLEGKDVDQLWGTALRWVFENATAPETIKIPSQVVLWLIQASASNTLEYLLAKHTPQRPVELTLNSGGNLLLIAAANEKIPQQTLTKMAELERLSNQPAADEDKNTKPEIQQRVLAARVMATKNFLHKKIAEAKTTKEQKTQQATPS